MKNFKLPKLEKLINNVRNLEVNNICFVVFRDNTVQKIVIDLNRIGQLLDKGVKSDNSTLPLYSVSYQKVYSFEGVSRAKTIGEPYLLLDTGDFYKSFRLIQKTDGFIIYANDEKDDGSLQDKYGFGVPILGLTEESISKLTEEIKPYILKEIRRQILS